MDAGSKHAKESRHMLPFILRLPLLLAFVAPIARATTCQDLNLRLSAAGVSASELALGQIADVSKFDNARIAQLEVKASIIDAKTPDKAIVSLIRYKDRIVVVDGHHALAAARKNAWKTVLVLEYTPEKFAQKYGLSSIDDISIIVDEQPAEAKLVIVEEFSGKK